MTESKLASWKDLANSFAGKEMEWQDDSAFRGEINYVKIDEEKKRVTVYFNWVVIRRDGKWYPYQMHNICFDSRTPALKMGEETWKVGQMGFITGFVHMTHKFDRDKIVKPATKKVAPDTSIDLTGATPAEAL